MTKAREQAKQRWATESATFRMSPATLTFHEGGLFEIRTCEELLDGRWEGFVSMRPVKPATERVQ